MNDEVTLVFNRDGLPLGLFINGQQYIGTADKKGFCPCPTNGEDIILYEWIMPIVWMPDPECYEKWDDYQKCN